MVSIHNPDCLNGREWLARQMDRAGIKYVRQHAEGNTLRVETTIYNVADFRTYRKAEGDEDGKEKWLPMRKGVADLHRRAEVSETAKERYWNALASIDDSARVEELVRRLEQPFKWKGGRVRGLRYFRRQMQIC